MEYAIYKRLNIELSLDKELKGVFGEHVRSSLIAKGLLDDEIAHGHNQPQRGRAGILFRRGYGNKLNIVATTKDGIEYLQSKLVQLASANLEVPTVNGGNIKCNVTNLNVSNGIDRIVVGQGFHLYKTITPLSVFKPGKPRWGSLLEASRAGDAETQKALAADCVARSIRTQIADMKGVKYAMIPKVHVSFGDDGQFRIWKDKRGISFLTYRGVWGANVAFTGSKEGVGVCGDQAKGFGQIQLIRGAA